MRCGALVARRCGARILFIPRFVIRRFFTWRFVTTRTFVVLATTRRFVVLATTRRFSELVTQLTFRRRDNNGAAMGSLREGGVRV